MAMRAGQRGERDPHRAVSMSKRFRHGHARLGKKTATYRAWATMHDRCTIVVTTLTTIGSIVTVGAVAG